MTHASILTPEHIDWTECYIERFSGNNGIVLQHKRNPNFSEVLFFIQGEDIGIMPEDADDRAISRATPLLRVMLDIHNRAVRAAWKRGRREAKADVRAVLEAD